MLDIRLLGAVEARHGGHVLDLGRPRQRLVFAALAFEPTHAVPVDVLIDRVWGQAPPERVRDSLYVYIARLRQVLGDGSLSRSSAGYLLNVEPECVDVQRFRQLLEQSRTEEVKRRAELLDDALALWRGRPLEGLDGDWVDGVRQVCAQLRVDAAVGWAKAHVESGDPEVVIGPLARLVPEQPLVEPLVAVLMRALHAAGRGAEALNLFADIRNQLAEQLGVDPGHELREAHQAILRDDRHQAETLPAQLPLATNGFTGRETELSYLDSTDPGVVVISGTAGVGKTSLALHWAHKAAARYPDGQLYVNLRGFEPLGTAPLDPAQAVPGFLEALGVPADRKPATLDAQVGLYRSLLAHKRVLLVLDNARDSEQVKPLLPGGEACKAIVTSRNPLAGLVAGGAHLLTLDVFSVPEARLMLSHRMGQARLAAEPSAVDDMVQRCAGLPIALAVVAARAAMNPQHSLAALADQLNSTLDGFNAGEPHTDVQAVFSWSYQALNEPSARLFRLLGLHPGPDISLPAAGSLAALAIRRVRSLLDELTGAHLIIEHTPGRYTFHDLLRAYATDLAHTIESHEERHAATGRLLDHYLHTAYTGACLLNPARDPMTRGLAPPEPGTTAENLNHHQRALDWFTAEHAVLLATVDYAVATAEFDTRTWQLAWTLRHFLDRRGHWHDHAAVHHAAVTAAARLADPAAQANAHRNLAQAYNRLGRFDEGQTHLKHALHLYGQAGDVVGQGFTHHSLGIMWERQGRYSEALDHAWQSVDLFRAAGHQRGLAMGLNAVGWYQILLGNHEQALTYCQQGLLMGQELGDRDFQANAWDSLGYAHHHLGHHGQAIACYQQALDLFRDLGDRYYEATALTHLGDTHHAVGSSRAARIAWQQALTILDELEHPDVEQVRGKLSGQGSR